jgi:hypothetical protein
MGNTIGKNQVFEKRSGLMKMILFGASRLKGK